MKQNCSIVYFLTLALTAGAATNNVPAVNWPSAILSQLSASNSPQSDKLGDGKASDWESFKELGLFVMALVNGKADNVWVGTEGNGVWRFNPYASGTNQWTQFTTTNGLGDDYAYSLAVDKQGRIWAGHLNHGVSVFNGSTWSNYDVPNGPIGERIKGSVLRLTQKIVCG